ncbi:MAG: response regulator transcription factor [Mediterranea sp.]|jgi:DNA-binding response OmpR family regulator|nr:response regulator transcription factor [Mediterranea sp.]
MNNTNILFVDDDVALGNVITLALEYAGYEVHYQTKLTGIKEVVKELQPNIIVLDVEIGDRNGMDVVPELKVLAPETPILFISSHVDAEYVVKAIGLGAVSYLKKPFEIPELLAYIRRFTNASHSSALQVGKFSLVVDDNRLMKGEVVVKQLTALECKLLKLLVLNLNLPLSREQIEQEVWGRYATESTEHSLNNYISKLRRYLAEDETIRLNTIPKVGYKLSVQS